MKSTLMVLALLVICASAAFATSMGQLTLIEVTEVERVNDFLVVTGVTNDTDPPQTPSAALGTRFFVNGFMTHTHPKGGWKICIPISAVHFDENQGYKIEIYAYDISCSVSYHKIHCVKPDEVVNRKAIFNKLHHGK